MGPFYLPNIAGTALSEPIIDTLNNMIKKSKTLNQKIMDIMNQILRDEIKNIESVIHLFKNKDDSIAISQSLKKSIIIYHYTKHTMIKVALTLCVSAKLELDGHHT